ncbi:unnamed protein product [Rotaria sordida]|uniref:Ig-like domain-containing protein n=1 Tax=Rotaria sordida TaxID=392033 RepID=A0A815YFX6_9BILA|nr:unnamed protein product [Rotaria sordida]CAF1570334.1 unnamed protein product [Rotaria sordida]
MQDTKYRRRIPIDRAGALSSSSSSSSSSSDPSIYTTDVQSFLHIDEMIIRRLMTTLFLTVLHTMTNSLNDDSHISRDYINVNVGKRVRMECELSNSTMSGNMKGLWLRLEDAEVFFYSTSRINLDQRFQIEQRPILHIINGTSSYEIMTYSLTIDDVRLSDDGTYSCQEDNRIIKLFVLNIVERPYFVTDTYTTLLRTQIGKNVSIACEAHGKPSPFLSWIKKIDDEQPKTMINCTTTPTTCQLNLYHVNRWHNGIYECVATNSIGTIGRFYTLDVQFPPDVYSPKEKTFHSIDDTIIFECLIDANPEPDIRWLHRFTNDINQEMDLSNQLNQGFYNHNSRRENQILSITQEKINATRWKTNLFIKHIPRHFFNSNFVCRATNHYGQDERSIKLIQNHYHISKKHRHTTTTTTTTIMTTTLDLYKQYNADKYQSSSTTHFLSHETNDIINRSRRLSSHLFYSFIIGLYSFVQ